MSHELIHGPFARIGARVKVRREFLSGRIRLAVRRDGRGEHFEIALNPAREPVVRVLEVSLAQRRLVLQVLDAPSAPARHREGDSRFLCGRGRRLFVSAIYAEACDADFRLVKVGSLLASQEGGDS